MSIFAVGWSDGLNWDEIVEGSHSRNHDRDCYWEGRILAKTGQKWKFCCMGVAEIENQGLKACSSHTRAHIPVCSCKGWAKAHLGLKLLSKRKARHKKILKGGNLDRNWSNWRGGGSSLHPRRALGIRWWIWQGGERRSGKSLSSRFSLTDKTSAHLGYLYLLDLVGDTPS